MSRKIRWQIAPAIFTLALVACQDSITGIPEPVVAAAPVEVVEAVAPVALITSGPCVRPATSLISWWPGDDDFQDIPEDPDNYQDVVGSNHIATHAGVAIVQGVHDQAFRLSGMSTQIEIDNSSSLQ
jgi:hypothetical protein